MMKKRELVAETVGFRRRFNQLEANETQQLASSGFFSRLYPTYS
ncbi:MAG: hypothetical protein AAF485_03505 [Chloroflexota bacterium]